jgi:hypothetical protein
MYFKKIDPFGQDSASGGGPLNPSQPKEPKNSNVILAAGGALGTSNNENNQ